MANSDFHDKSNLWRYNTENREHKRHWPYKQEDQIPNKICSNKGSDIYTEKEIKTSGRVGIFSKMEVQIQYRRTQEKSQRRIQTYGKSRK